MPATTPSAALPIATLVLRILILANWFYGVAILVLLVAMPTERWILTSLGLAPSPEADRIIFGLRTIAVIGLCAVPLNYAILKRLRAMVETVRHGDPFVAPNARRLETIAWALLALQLLSLLVSAIAGWLAVLLTFVLARVFRQGTDMREELEGTV